MLSIGKIKGSHVAEAAKYYCETSPERSRKEDYYTQSGEPAGYFHGSGMEHIGLNDGQAVSTEDFQTLLDGKNPATGNDLTQNTKSEKRVAAFDMTFSAGKDLSILAGAGDDQLRETILEAHRDAVQAAMGHLESHLAFSRRGSKGADELEHTPGIAYASFEHMTTRGGDNGIDPLLHSHNVLFNAVRREDGTFGTLDAAKLYEAKMALGQMYRAELAKNIRETLNVTLEVEQVNGKYTDFKVSGLTNDQRRAFSQRREQVVEKLEAWKASLNDSKTAAAAAQMDKPKKGHIDRDELIDEWQSRANALGLDQKTINHITNAKPEQSQAFNETAVIQSLTAFDVRFKRQDILKAVAEEAMHAGEGIEAIEQRYREILDSDQLVKLGQDEKGRKIYTTAEMMEVEKELADIVSQGIDDKGHHIDKTDIDKHISDFQRQNGFELSTQQKEAIYHITERTGRVSTINGSAGAGKSTSMAVVREAYEAKGFKVIGCALAGKAAAELADSAGLKESLTIDRLLIELENGKRQFDDKTIILMDEGGMVGSRHARDLLKHANNAASIENKTIHTVLLGDVEQLKPVSAGPAFKTAQAVLRDQGQDTAILDEIRRQKSSYARDAVHDFTAGRAAEGLAEYHQRGQVKFYDAGDKAKVEDHKFEAVKGMVDTWKSDLAETKLTDIQMLVSTRKEAYQANYIAHTLMQKDGQIDGVNHTIDTPEGQRDFAIGDRIIFKKNDKNTQVNNGWTGTITDIRPNKDGELTITADVDGQGERTFSTADYKNIDWSYAITTHASQGITKDHTHVLASSDPNAMTDLSLFMVQMSRHKQSSTIHIAHETVREIYQEAEPTPEMVSRAEEQSAQQTPPEAKHDFGHFRRWISKMFSELTQRFQREQERQIETLSMLAELAQRDRQKDSTLDNFNDQQATKKTFAEDDPRSKLTAKERIKIAMSVNYDRDFSEADRQGELPKFDRHESKAIDRIAGQKHAESISTDNPLDKRDAWKQAAQEWMSMRSQDRRELLRQDAAQNYVNRQGNQATNRNTLKV